MELKLNGKENEGFAPVSTKKKATKKAVQHSSKSQQNTYLSNHANNVWRLHFTGMKPKQIAEAMMLKEGFGPRSDAITSKQVSNWIRYKKKSGQHPTFPVSGSNSNLKADFTDDCIINSSFNL